MKSEVLYYTCQNKLILNDTWFELGSVYVGKIRCFISSLVGNQCYILTQ